MKIAIVGAGLTGLVAAYRLSQIGHQVILIEKEDSPGGLTRGFKEKNWQWSLELFFHHLFTSDQSVKKLLTELNLKEKLFFTRPKTSIFTNGKVFQFDSPSSLLRFSPLPFDQRIRTGLATTYLKLTNNWQALETNRASAWLSKVYGQKPYRTLWEPLLRGKFGQYYASINMAWFWARIKKRSIKLGYIEGGFQTLIDKLVEKIKEKGGKVVLNTRIKNLNDIYHLSGQGRIIFTTPTEAFLKIVPGLPQDYQAKLKGLKMLGAVNLVLILNKKFLVDDTYWLNINEPDFSFVAVVEHTNFIDPRYYGGNHLLYVGGYYPQDHPYFKMNKNQLFLQFLPCLQKINPEFNQSSIINYQLSMDLYAQPIVPINYSKLIPSKNPLPGIFLANMQQVYPYDRGTNYAICLGEEVARLASCL